MKPFFAYRSFQQEFATVAAFAKQGVETICLTTSNTLCSLGTPYCPYPPTWLAPGVYDFAPLDQQITDVLRINPEFQIVLNIDLNAPAWWSRRADLWQNRNRADTWNELGRVVADADWRQETAAYLRALLRHTEAAYADAIIMYNLLCGGTTEWYDHSLGEESWSRRQAYRNWCQSQGWDDPVDLPPASVREHAGHGLLRDPRTEAAAIRYLRFCNWQIGDALLYVAGVAREVVGRRADLGAFYGYTLLPASRIACGVVGLDHVLAADRLDAVIGIGTYGKERPIGGASGFLQPVDSFRHHRLGYVHECDQRTGTMNTHISSNVVLDWPPSWPDEAAVIAGIKREFCIALLRGASMWLFDMWGHFYDGERVHQTVGQLARLWREHTGSPPRPVAEVAMFIDEESWYHCNPGDLTVADYADRVMEALGHIGAPVEYYSFADLATLDLSRFKFVLLPNLFVVTDARRQLLADTLCRSGRHVLWFDRAGIIHNGIYDRGNVAALTGIEADSSGISRRQMDGWCSVQAAKPLHDPTELRRLAEAAGVHLYLDGGDPVWAGGDFIAVHGAAGGLRTIRLPRRAAQVRELFSDRLVATDAELIEDTFATPDTRLYHCRWSS